MPSSLWKNLIILNFFALEQNISYSEIHGFWVFTYYLTFAFKYNFQYIIFKKMYLTLNISEQHQIYLKQTENRFEKYSLFYSLICVFTTNNLDWSKCLYTIIQDKLKFWNKEAKINIRLTSFVNEINLFENLMKISGKQFSLATIF